MSNNDRYEMEIKELNQNCEKLELICITQCLLLNNHVLRPNDKDRYK